MCMKLEKQIIVYDDYNSKIYGGGELIGTITTNIGNPSPRHGFRIVEIHLLTETLWEQSRKMQVLLPHETDLK